MLLSCTTHHKRVTYLSRRIRSLSDSFRFVRIRSDSFGICPYKKRSEPLKRRQIRLPVLCFLLLFFLSLFFELKRDTGTISVSLHHPFAISSPSPCHLLLISLPSPYNLFTVSSSRDRKVRETTQARFLLPVSCFTSQRPVSDQSEAQDVHASSGGYSGGYSRMFCGIFCGISIGVSPWIALNIR